MIIKYMIKNQQELNLYKDIVERLEEFEEEESEEEEEKPSVLPELPPPTQKEGSLLTYFFKVVIVHLPLVWFFYKYNLCFCKA